MVRKDHSGLPLERGFYLDLHSGSVNYFTGEYSPNGHAVCEDIFGLHPFTESVTSEFKRIGNPARFLESLGSNSRFMSYKLRDLEKAASAQSQPSCAKVEEIPIRRMPHNAMQDSEFYKH